MTAVLPARLSPLAKARLAVEILGAYGRAYRRLRRDDVRTVLAAVRGPAEGAGGPTLDQADAQWLGWAVHRTLTLLPTDHRCLVQSVVLCGLLARRGTYGTLVIGVRPGDDFGAHAWVEVDGMPVTPVLEYARLTEL
jgi:hypothetical protein